MREEDHDPGMPFFDILEKLNKEGGFHRSVLATSEGLPVSIAPDDLKDDATGALMAMLQKSSYDLQNHLNMNGIDEITIRDQDRFRLVCRCFECDGDTLILASSIPPDHYHRRVMNRAIKRIRRQLA